MIQINHNLQKLIEKEMKIHIANIQSINTGMNNQLLKVTDTDGNQYVLKQYIKDERKRMWREYNAIKYLRSQNIKNIPLAHWCNQKLQVAVYSFEPGLTRSATDLTHIEVTKMADFLARLHTTSVKSSSFEFPPAVLACFSLSDYVKNINYRLNKFLEHMQNPHPLLASCFNTSELIVLFDRLKAKALVGLTSDEIDSELPLKNRRLSPIDFGPHNMLFTSDGRECFIDFEYFGLDDPARVLAEFQMHDRSSLLDHKLKQHFRNQYLHKVNASKDFEKHLAHVEQITSVEWLSIYLWSITPEKVSHRKFSDASFNEESYLQTQIDKFNNRLEILLK